MLNLSQNGFVFQYTIRLFLDGIKGVHVSMNNDVQDLHGTTLAHYYRLSSPVNGKPSYVMCDQAIWYSSVSRYCKIIKGSLKIYPLRTNIKFLSMLELYLPFYKFLAKRIPQMFCII